MTIKGQKVPRPSYKRLWQDAEAEAERYVAVAENHSAIAKAAERRAGERLTLLEAESDAVKRLRIALSEADDRSTYFYRNFIAMAMVALLEAGGLLYLLTMR